MAGDFATVPIRKESRRAAISSLSISCRFLRMSILDMVSSSNKSIITLVILTETTLPVKTFFCYFANLKKISYERTKLLPFRHSPQHFQIVQEAYKEACRKLFLPLFDMFLR